MTATRTGVLGAAVAAAVGLATGATPSAPPLPDPAPSLRRLAAGAGGTVGVAVLHVESGRTVSVNGRQSLALYSVFKLPLAVAVLKDVEEGRLRLEQTVHVTPADIAPGLASNTERWRQPVDVSVRDLLAASMIDSDNTSSDKLLQLVGGPEAVTRRMRALGLGDIQVRSTVRGMQGKRRHPNVATADALALLLARLQKGEVLAPPQLQVLLDVMVRSTTGLRRLRGDLPEGTPVADKTGTGGAGAATNDVGVITLPDGGHLAMAVLINGSPRSAEKQEKVIAELARAAYDAHVTR